MAKAAKKDLKKTIEDELAHMMASESEPSEGRMKLLKLGIGFLAVQAKLEESEYGSFFDNDPGNPENATRTESAPRKRAARGNGAADPCAEPGSLEA